MPELISEARDLTTDDAILDWATQGFAPGVRVWTLDGANAVASPTSPAATGWRCTAPANRWPS